jgi:hypothetical protein
MILTVMESEILAAWHGRLYAVNLEGKVIMDYVFERYPGHGLHHESMWGPVAADLNGDGVKEICWNVDGGIIYAYDWKREEMLDGFPYNFYKRTGGLNLSLQRESLYHRGVSFILHIILMKNLVDGRLNGYQVGEGAQVLAQHLLSLTWMVTDTLSFSFVQEA